MKRALGFLFLLLAASAVAAQEPGFVSIFDGVSLKGWVLEEGRGPGYVVENGILICSQDGGGYLLTDKEYANFVLKLEFRTEKFSNNGIAIRTPLKGDPAYAGMEIQLLDVNVRSRDPKGAHGSIYGVVPAKQGFLKPTGEWNQETITANGRRITVELNGTVVLDADLDTITDPEVLKRHPGLARASGRVGFCGHKTRVEFRNIRIQELP